MNAETPGKPAQPRACDVDVWDGPYRMNCGLTLVKGKCITHGDSTVRRWRAAQDAKPEPATAATPAQADRDRADEEITREFAGWAEAQGYDDSELYSFAEMDEAFAAGMQAARDLDAAQPPRPAPGSPLPAGQQLAYDEDAEADEIAAEDDPDLDDDDGGGPSSQLHEGDRDDAVSEATS